MKKVLALLLMFLSVGLLKTQAQTRLFVFRNVTMIDMAGALPKPGAWVCPTLAYHHADAFHDQKEYAEDPCLKYLPKDLLDEWAELKCAAPE